MEEKKEEGTCGKGGCGLKCCCCVCKAVKALVLLLIGIGIGFCLARCCRHRSYCPVKGAPASAGDAPAQTKAQ